MRKSKPDIRYLLEPRSIAIIGASNDKNKIGYKIVNNIIKGGFKGNIYPINLKENEVLGYKAYRSVEEIEEEVDVSCIAIPARNVLDAVRTCGRKGVKFSLIISSGFSEVGNIEEEKKIVLCAYENGMRILGPNIFGIYSASSSLNATFGPENISRGSVAIITQSGALGLAMIGKTAVEGIGLSAIVSVGNKSDVDETDLVEYFVKDEGTRLILIYIEGIKNGERLIEVLKVSARKKPIVVIKSGRSKRGAMAAVSHTGSLAGSDEVFNDIVSQCGVLRAESIKDAFNLCKFFTSSPLPAGENTLIITNGGGIGVMATDACEKYGVKLYDDVVYLKEIFSDVTFDFGSTKNPIDLTGQASSADYTRALEVALRNDEINSVIGLYCETAVFGAESLAKIIEESSKKYKEARKPLVFSIFGGETTERCIGSLRVKDIPVFSDVYEAVYCLGAMYSVSRNLSSRSSGVDYAEIDMDAVDKIIKDVRADGRNFLLSYEAEEMMRVCNISTPFSYVAHNIDEAIRYSEKIGYPVVMKIISKDIVHKSDVGGVILDLESSDEVVDAYQALMHNVRSHKPDAKVAGVEVAEMVEAGVETIIGARRDNIFGPILMFGFGGIYVEVLKDVSFRSVPLDRDEVRKMIKQVKLYPLLLGVRGERKKDIGALVEVILKLGTLIQRCRDISDIELNPVFVYDEGLGVKAVDVRVLLSNPQGGD